MKKIILTEDLNLGEYDELKMDYNNSLPNFIININNEAIIKKGTELYYSQNPFNAAEILANENNESVDVILEEYQYEIIK